jgi:hypothetical protein
MKRRLSSLSTPFYKFAPAVLVVVGSLWLIYEYGKFKPLYFLIVAGIIGVRFFRLKEVQLSRDVLYVSSYRRSIAIPIEDIARVELSHWWEGIRRLTTMHPRKYSAFGLRIEFVPRGWGFFGSRKADEISAAISARHNKALQLTAR